MFSPSYSTVTLSPSRFTKNHFNTTGISKRKQLKAPEVFSSDGDEHGITILDTHGSFLILNELEAARKQHVEEEIDMKVRSLNEKIEQLRLQTQSVLEKKRLINEKEAKDKIIQHKNNLKQQIESKKQENEKKKQEIISKSQEQQRIIQVEQDKKRAALIEEENKRKILLQIEEEKKRKQDEENKKKEEEQKKKQELADQQKKHEELKNQQTQLQNHQKIEQNQKAQEVQQKVEKEQQIANQQNEQQKKNLNYISLSSKKKYQEVKQKTKPINQLLEQFPKTLQPQVWKDLRIFAVKNITSGITRISSDPQQIRNCFQGITEALSKTTNDQNLHIYCLNELAKSFVRQGETQVLGLQDSAFSIAKGGVALCIQYGDLMDLILGHFYQVCPYVVPRYMKKKENQTNEDFKINKLKFRKNDSNQDGFESEEVYYNRMKGFVALYAAMIQTEIPQGKVHPMPVENGWRWIANILNKTPRKITASLIFVFLEVCGHKLLKVYKNQFVKILHFIKNVYINKIPDTAIAGKTQILTFIDKFEKTGTIQSIEGKV